MAKKQDVLGGLSGLLSTPQAPKPTTSTPQAPAQDPIRGTMKTPRGSTIRVCYNLNTDVVAKIKALAAYDRKNINEVYNEALQAYIDSWTPTPQEPPKF